ncbi:hypothetical protein [Catenulispora sp. GAS73]|uniref:hypothetical protein n=1 Tax=Catenulispora sp. GAS73 TaxID=3156269 RepID=UPI003513DEEE
MTTASDATKPGWFRKATTRRGAQNPATTSNTATKQRNAGNSGQKADQSRTAAEAPDARVAPSL